RLLRRPAPPPHQLPLNRRRPGRRPRHADRRDDHQGHHQARPDGRRGHRGRRGSVGQPAGRPRPGRRHRSPRVRHRLERTASRRRPPSRRPGSPDRQLLAGQAGLIAMRILAISGSLREGSHNTALLRAAADLVPDGVSLELFDGLAAIPHYNGDHDHEQPPAEVAALREAIAAADAILVATPEYNGSVPGVLKNAVDWASRPHRESALWGKTAAVVGASTGAYGALWAQA